MAVIDANTTLSGLYKKKGCTSATSLELGNISFSSTNKQRTVRFAQIDDNCYAPPTYFIEEEDIGSIWYTGEIEECALGLEDHSILAIATVVTSVLREQQRQETWGINNKEKIFSASLLFSKKSLKYAKQQALMVESDVRSLYQETDPIPNVKKAKKRSRWGARFTMGQLKSGVKKRISPQ
eukprot:15324298-Ditylum_brightwellii.AAC.1